MLTLRDSTILTVLAGLILAAGSVTCRAATSSTLDVLPIDVAGVPDRVEVGTVKPRVPVRRETAKPATSGNPLWAVPLSALTATQERPVFSVSRRPPPRAVIGPVI